MSYPDWSYFPRRSPAPDWSNRFIGVVEECREFINSTDHNEFNSNQVLELLRPGLEVEGWSIETGKKYDQKIHRPVLFGDRNIPRVSYEIDGWNEEHKAVLEVEAGRGWMGNAFYRNLVRTSLIHGAEFLAIGLRLSYTYSNVTAQNDGTAEGSVDI